ncbi:hypothetical protein JQ621_32105 [Bradyrhizobium manausense]|uniref:hypothetical protein n=1 Tax=Bradyrhizobium manausense TaxID=989370 RepID=UPI001BABAEF8|nr:hypothetical protein [Bradyrhizobium manausense]MBR1092115.1 hypothetical protein [Bradyrhizobium manausense]
MAGSVTTRGYDLARSGANNSETELTATAVRTKGIVKLFSIPIPDDPRLEAQPLAVGGVHTPGGRIRDLIFQATMGNWVYAFDAATGDKVWATHLGRPIVGTRAIDGHLTNVNWGILSTPVIDEAAGILYACAWISDDGSVARGQHFLAALRITDGTRAHPLLNLEGAVYTPPGGLPVQKFVSAERKQRSALTLTQNHVLIPFGTIAETSKTARGWLIAVDVHAWHLAAAWCSTVTGIGGGLWQSGAGPAVGPDGAIYVITGNGAFSPQHGDFGESIVRLALRTGPHVHFEVVSWWSPWTDANRVGATAAALVEDDDDEHALPSNVSLTTVIGHARRMGMALKPIHAREMAHVAVTSGPHALDAQIAPVVAQQMDAMNESMWSDQDFGSGGPVYVASAHVVLAAGKDGILYSGNADALGSTQPGDLAAGHFAANYAKLRMPPILYTYFDPAVPPAPPAPTQLNLFPGGATRHLHGSPLLFSSAIHGTMHFVGGENSALRAWSIAADGTTVYLAGSNEIASPQSPRPPGGMPGWSITLAANNGADGIIVAMVPYQDSNMLLSPGRFLVYDAQNFAANPDGSQRLQVIWDSENWGPEHAFMHPKFNRPIVWKGRIYRPTYNGQLDVYGLTH